MTNDLISREEAIDEIRDVLCCDCHCATSKRDCAVCNIGDLIGRIIDIPAIDAVPVVHGQWVHCDGKTTLWHCSECGGRIMYNQTRKTYNINKLPVSESNKFCKHCGAKMDKERDEDD